MLRKNLGALKVHNSGSNEQLQIGMFTVLYFNASYLALRLTSQKVHSLKLSMSCGIDCTRQISTLQAE